MIKAVFFDMDGTVLDTLRDLQNAVNHTLEHFGFPKRENEYIRQILGFGAHNLIERALPEGTPSEKIEEVFAYYKPYYKAHSTIFTRPFDGIPELIKYLQDKGLKTAIISNKPDPTVQVLKADFFPNVYCLGEKPGVPIKPAPDAINNVMREMGVTPDETIYVGDTEFDIQAAANAHTHLAVICHGFRDRDFLEKICNVPIAENVTELKENLDKMINNT